MEIEDEISRHAETYGVDIDLAWGRVPQRWTPSFGQGFVTAKVESGSRFKLLRLLAFE